MRRLHVPVSPSQRSDNQFEHATHRRALCNTQGEKKKSWHRIAASPSITFDILMATFRHAARNLPKKKKKKEKKERRHLCARSHPQLLSLGAGRHAEGLLCNRGARLIRYQKKEVCTASSSPPSEPGGDGGSPGPPASARHNRPSLVTAS